MADFTKEDYEDAAKLAYLYVKKAGLTFEQYAKEMVAEFGDAIKPHLKKYWDEHNPPERTYSYTNKQPEPKTPVAETPNEVGTNPQPKLLGTVTVPIIETPKAPAVTTPKKQVRTRLSESRTVSAKGTHLEILATEGTTQPGSNPDVQGSAEVSPRREKPVLVGTIGSSCVGLASSIYVLICISPLSDWVMSDAMWSLMAAFLLAAGAFTVGGLLKQTFAFAPLSIGVGVSSYTAWTFKPRDGRDTQAIYLYFCAACFTLAIAATIVFWWGGRKKQVKNPVASFECEPNKNPLANFERGPNGFSPKREN